MKVCILLSTYNGERYIDELLESLYKQTVRENMLVMIRDDGSTDNTVDKISKWVECLNIKLCKGKNKGPKESFHELLKKAPQVDYYAYCDQDDVWKPDKIEMAIEKIKHEENKNRIPVLYFCKLTYVDQNMNRLSFERNISQADLILEKAFVSNVAMGCTMVMNQFLLDELLKIDFKHFFMHDVITLMTAIITGKVLYDDKSYIFYRKHSSNVTQGKNIKDRLEDSFKFWFKNKNYSIVYQANALYMSFENKIPKEQKQILITIINYKRGLERLKIVFSKKYRSNMTRENRSFICRILLGLA